MGFFQNTCKPEGIGGKIMVKMMNAGHNKLANWGFSNIEIKHGLKILDVGCGGGANVKSWLLRSDNSYVIGLDYSEVSVDESKKLNKKAIEEKRCEILQGDVSNMQFEDNTFDYISAFETIYFWPGLEKSFNEVFRVLKNNGTFMICNESDGENPNHEKWTKIIDGLNIYIDEEIVAALEKSGFKNIKVIHEQNKHWLCITSDKTN